MRTICVMILTLAFATVASAQVIVVKPKTMTWDHPKPDLVIEYRMYCQQTPGVEQTPLTLIATIPAAFTPVPVMVADWVFNLTTEGDWYCAVSAAIPAENIESPLSNEVWLKVIDLTPRNFREKAQ